MKSNFSKQQIKSFVKEAQESVGGKAAWSFVGPGVRRMAIEAKAHRIMAMQWEGTKFGAVDCRNVYFDMAVEAGIIEES